MVIQNLCIVVLWMKVASAFEGLILPYCFPPFSLGPSPLFRAAGFVNFKSCSKQLRDINKIVRTFLGATVMNELTLMLLVANLAYLAYGYSFESTQ